ncbi:hypothetical protein AOQ84DRAFT_383769 [Glonium stellatum]|uniref:Uncharacterized protein n=1 Tax=Glonium stellatum TaxID=574774 RepID=A0A8E2EMX4_9PEZI|nr:hypothetical protein AOQ84DRAFT_383769 [Glonium stellatum]
MNSTTDTPVTVTTVILSSPSDWNEWIEVIKSKAIVGRVWKYVNPYTKREDLPSLVEPSRPTAEDVNKDKAKISLLNTDEKAMFRVLQEDSVSRTYLIYTFNCDTTYDILVSLKQRVALSDNVRKIQLASQYAKIKRIPRNQNYEVWLQEWEKIYTECKALALPEVDGDRSVKDFVYAVDSASPGWSNYWKNELLKLEWKKERLPSFFDLIELYRNNRRMEDSQKARSPKGYFATTVQHSV